MSSILRSQIGQLQKEVDLLKVQVAELLVRTGGEVIGPVTDNTLVGDILDEELAKSLVSAGHKTVGDVREASDEDLLEIAGIGPARLATIREATKE